MLQIYSELLESWCDALLKLQITEMKDDGIYGDIMCPSCSRIHGRCSDAIYPFMYMAKQKKDKKYLDAAVRLFDWSEHMSRPDGSFINDTSSDWKGITVFSVIQLGEAIRNHGDILDSSTLLKWKNRLRSAVEFLNGYINISVGNINYPITCSAAMAIAGVVLEEPRYYKRGYELAHKSLEYFTENHLLFGEGKPAHLVTPRDHEIKETSYKLSTSENFYELYF